MNDNSGLTNSVLLVARNLQKTYQLGRRLVPVLRGVDLELYKGSFVALQGASGAGKSTLLHLLAGLDNPTAGEVSFEGMNLFALPEKDLSALRNRKIGFIFQAYHLLPELDALENVCAPARIGRIPPVEAEKRAIELLQRVGLGDRLDHRPNELSGGEQQRVAIARALINNPELILADEPTGNLDSVTGREIIDLLCELHAERKTALLIATHDANVASRAPKVLVLADGKIISKGQS